MALLETLPVQEDGSDTFGDVSNSRTTNPVTPEAAIFGGRLHELRTKVRGMPSRPPTSHERHLAMNGSTRTVLIRIARQRRSSA
jgi:hypothetical protein